MTNFKRFKKQGKDTLSQENKDKVAVIVPIYGDYGENHSLLILNDGSTLIRKTSAKSTIERHAKLFGQDVKSLQNYYGRYFNTIQVPLPFTKDLIMIPLKLRIPEGKHDGAYGYINYYQIDKTDTEIIDTEEEVYVKLNNNKKIKVFQKLKTADERINQGRVINIMYAANHRINHLEDTVIKEILKKIDKDET